MTRTVKQITGPVIPLPTPFNEKFEVDYEALKNYVEFLVRSGIQNVMTTIGTSRFNLLSDDEIKKVNETVVRAAAGKCVTIVANPVSGSTSKACEFAKHSEQIGADFYLLYFPERHYGEENTYSFFKSVADSSQIPVLIHEMPMRNGLGGGTVQFSMPLLERLLGIPNIVGFKEEALDAEYSNQIVSTFSSRAIIVGAGGGMSRYLNRDHRLGSKAYLGGIGNFFPALELEFFEAMSKNDLAKASQIVNEKELPYFEKVVPVGWHPSLKIALSVKNLMPSFERPPMKQPADSEKELLREILMENKWM